MLVFLLLEASSVVSTPSASHPEVYSPHVSAFSKSTVQCTFLFSSTKLHANFKI